jgi:hypothetical protein
VEEFSVLGQVRPYCTSSKAGNRIIGERRKGFDVIDKKNERYYRGKLSEIEGGRWVSIFAKLSKRFGDNWDAGTIFGNLEQDPARMDRLFAFLQNDCLWEPVEHKRAAAIMGGNFYGIGHAMERLGEAYTLEQLQMLERIPYSPALLERCKKTHVLLPGYPLSLGALYQNSKRPDTWQEDKGGQPKTPDHETYLAWSEQDFWKRRRMEMRWHLIRIVYEDPADSYESRAYSHQVSKLAKNEYVPHLVDILYARWVVQWSHRFVNASLRVADLTVDGKRLVLGGSREAYLDTQQDGDRNEHGHVASAIKVEV